MATLYSDETVARARELHAAGMRTTVLAREIGATRQTIHAWLSGARAEPTKGRTAFSAEEVLEIRRLFAVAGVNQPELARRFKTTQSAISRVVRGAAYKDVGGYRLAPFARHAKRKLSDQQVRQIRELHAKGHSAARLARRFRVSASHVQRVARGRVRPDTSQSAAEFNRGLEVSAATKETT